MTAKQLIDKLSRYHQDSEVVISDKKFAYLLVRDVSEITLVPYNGDFHNAEDFTTPPDGVFNAIIIE